jgi:hypothetical protein
MRAIGRRGSRGFLGLLLVVGAVAMSLGCSSSQSDPLTEQQRDSLTAVAEALEQSNAVISEVFDVDAVVPRLERWDRGKLGSEEALSQLRSELPGGACRTAVEALLTVERDMSRIRRDLIDKYRRERYGLVAEDTAAYARVKIASGIPAEQAVATSCGRSVTGTSPVPGSGTGLTAAQNARFDAVQAASGEAAAAYSAAFPVAEFVSDVEQLQAADVAVTAALEEIIALVSDEPCRSALSDLLELEQEQAALRSSTISAGKAGDLPKMLATVGEYSEVNASSAPHKAARQRIARGCGVDI